MCDRLGINSSATFTTNLLDHKLNDWTDIRIKWLKVNGKSDCAKGILYTTHICDWIWEKGSYMRNYKYLEIWFWKFNSLYILRMHGAACMHFSTNP